jgi:hypothetical protein
MPKRIVDGDALWRSQKLSLVQPLKFRAEFANLIPLALANGVFEADPDLIWSTVYSYNRPDFSRKDVVALLAEFERVGLLVRWQDVNGSPEALNGNHGVIGKVWGYWVGINKPGRLPGESRRGKNERVGPTPPLSVDSIKQPLDSSEQPLGTDLRLGSGLGLGSGSGLGKALRFAQPSVTEISAYVQERNSQIDPQQFFDFYQSKGWKVGNQPMKDWKAAIRTWERRNGETPRKENPGEYLLCTGCTKIDGTHDTWCSVAHPEEHARVVELRRRMKTAR